MKKLSILLAICICTMLVFGLCACKKSHDDEEIDMNIDLSQKPTLSVLMPNSGRRIEEVNNDDTAKLIQELTGYKVDYTQLPANAATTLNTELMDKRHYNAIKLTKNQFSDLVKDDMLVDITDALTKFAPYALQCISKESWDVVTVNGRIYGIPERASSDNIENPIVFNKDLLLKCNLEMPKTLDEFENVLRVLTNYIGKPALTFDRYTPLVYAVSAAFGIYSEWQEYNIGGQTKVLYYMNAPGYKDYVDYMHTLYQAGYIDAQAGTNTAAVATQSFVNGFASGNGAKSAAYACSLWTVPAIVTGLQSNGVINATQAGGTLENELDYLRALKVSRDAPESVYRSSGYSYITAIPYYEAKQAGYVLDWVNSKLIDSHNPENVNEGENNFRSIVLGIKDYHWTYSQTDGYLPLSEHFAEKDQSSYYLTGSNELVYTDYWKARVRKQPELFRAWSILMNNADEVGVYNVVDFTPPIEDYTKNRSGIEENAQDWFYIMMKDGTGKMNEFKNKLNSQLGCDAATKAINSWYNTYKK